MTLIASQAPEAPAATLSPIELWNEKRLQTQVLDLAEDTVSIRSLDWDRDRFDIEFGCVPGTHAHHMAVVASQAMSPACTPAVSMPHCRMLPT
jgi:hypothetical protein